MITLDHFYYSQYYIMKDLGIVIFNTMQINITKKIHRYKVLDIFLKFSKGQKGKVI